MADAENKVHREVRFHRQDTWFGQKHHSEVENSFHNVTSTDDNSFLSSYFSIPDAFGKEA